MKPFKRRRQSVIARLPKLLRDQVNQMLLDGVPYARVVSLLAQSGITANRSQLGDWHKGGYQEWLDEQRRLEDLKAIRDFSLKAVKDLEDSAIPRAGMQIAAAQLYELLTAFDPQSLREKLDGDPAQYARLVQVLAKLADGGLKFERYRAQVEKQKAEIANHLADAKPAGLSDDALAEIEKALRMM